MWFFADLYHRQSKNRAFFGLTLGGSPLPELLILLLFLLFLLLLLLLLFLLLLLLFLLLLLLLLLLWSLSFSFGASPSLLGSHPDTELLPEAALLPDAELSKMRNSPRCGILSDAELLPEAELPFLRKIVSSAIGFAPKCLKFDTRAPFFA